MGAADNSGYLPFCRVQLRSYRMFFLCWLYFKQENAETNALDNIDLENGKLHKASWASMARRSEGKNGHTKSEGNTNILASSEVSIQYSDSTFFDEDNKSLSMVDYGKQNSSYH